MLLQTSGRITNMISVFVEGKEAKMRSSDITTLASGTILAIEDIPPLEATKRGKLVSITLPTTPRIRIRSERKLKLKVINSTEDILNNLKSKIRRWGDQGAILAVFLLTAGIK